MVEVERQESELSRLMEHVKQSERVNQEIDNKLQAISTSLNDAVCKIKLRKGTHKELNFRLDQKKQQQALLYKQDSREQAMKELITEIESTVRDLERKVSEIEAEIRQHECDEKELERNLREKEIEFQEQSTLLQRIREQHAQCQATLEEKSRQFDFQLQLLVAQQHSTTELEKQLRVCVCVCACCSCRFQSIHAHGSNFRHRLTT